MWLALASPADLDALWAASRLRARLGSVLVLPPELLCRGARWEHRLGRAGVVTDIQLADGRRLRGDELRGVVNRLVMLAPGLFAGASPSDQSYAMQEIGALFMSWLAGLRCPVLNRPSARGLAGWCCSPVEWVALARSAGLPVSPRRVAGLPGSCSDTSLPASARLAGTMFVVGGQALWRGDGDGEAVAVGCQTLAETTGSGLLAVHFARLPHRGGAASSKCDAAACLTFAGATTLPALSQGGDELVEALCEALQGERASGTAGDCEAGHAVGTRRRAGAATPLAQALSR